MGGLAYARTAALASSLASTLATLTSALSAALASALTGHAGCETTLSGGGTCAVLHAMATALAAAVLAAALALAAAVGVLLATLFMRVGVSTVRVLLPTMLVGMLLPAV